MRPLVAKLQVKKINNVRYLSAILDVLNRHYKIKVSYSKPMLSRTYRVTIEGAQEASYESDFRAFAFSVGWQVESA